MNAHSRPPPFRLSAQARIDSPLGPLTLAASERGLAIVWFDGQAHRSEHIDAPVAPQHPHLQQAARELDAYFHGADSGCLHRAERGAGDGAERGFVEGARRAFTVPLDPQGTPFQQQVWQALLGIAPGQLSSYGAIARQLGRPDAARAVGAAVGRNPIGIIVPCHRVIGSSGALTGYAAGLPRKQALLALEGARSAELLVLQ